VSTFAALPRASDWWWLLDREDSPWYPTMRLFRQRELGNWTDVIERMAAALEEVREKHTSGACEQIVDSPADQ
jgi:hypothetical protein